MCASGSGFASHSQIRLSLGSPWRVPTIENLFIVSLPRRRGLACRNHGARASKSNATLGLDPRSSAAAGAARKLGAVHSSGALPVLGVVEDGIRGSGRSRERAQRVLGSIECLVPMLPAREHEADTT